MERCTCGHELEQLGLGYGICDAACHGQAGRWWVDRGTMQTGINSEAHNLAPLALVYKRDKDAAEARLAEAERLLGALADTRLLDVHYLDEDEWPSFPVLHQLEKDIRAFLAGKDGAG